MKEKGSLILLNFNPDLSSTWTWIDTFYTNIKKQLMCDCYNAKEGIIGD